MIPTHNAATTTTTTTTITEGLLVGNFKKFERPVADETRRLLPTPFVLLQLPPNVKLKSFVGFHFTLSINVPDSFFITISVHVEDGSDNIPVYPSPSPQSVFAGSSGAIVAKPQLARVVIVDIKQNASPHILAASVRSSSGSFLASLQSFSHVIVLGSSSSCSDTVFDFKYKRQYRNTGSNTHNNKNNTNA